MAIAVVAFALVAMVGTLPVGLQSMRDSQNDQALATIQNQIRGELSQIAFVPSANTSSSIRTLPTSTYYYTVEGVKTDAASTTLVPYYKAQFAVTNGAVNGNQYANTAAINTPTGTASVTVILTYPSPSFAQTSRFSMFATKQGAN